MNNKSEFLSGGEGVAEFDQVKAAAQDKLRQADGFILVTGTWEGDEDMNITQAAGVQQMDAVVFMAIATAEVSKVLKEAVLAATEEVEEIA